MAIANHSKTGETRSSSVVLWGLRDEMAARGLSQQALALASGVSQPTISVALHGQPVSAKTALAIQQALVVLPRVLDPLLRRVS